ncbi:DNA-binding MarR family transcriptional regulator [Amycolatopsis bartoniae]|uniref:MarR family transcriptional regulator n=1 Tax=Amycolatopsis bartoniae TaxID=941986 RepID=A0A8H9IYI6_9PSEU|nr:MarR family transcriptional regulator [Amycolatopsis bartoniae]MBB2938978.1 DNA-binding MarR family transcriptional regulator [Amycolatopsis bartoniae]TVT11223.1 MarR family transcriptional regulator [Amycolatopsis bartoniae]GHF65803.1 MarR family transcriptional regulator [Amycolatopsis bartoniae]
MHERTANLLGAAALAVADLVLAEAQRRAGVSASGAAALVVLSAAPGLSVTELGRRVGLSQPAAARMVDSLQAADLLERRPGRGREVAVHLTARGATTARELLAARGAGLTDVLGALEPVEQEALAGLLGKVLARAYDRVGNADLLCRLCDRGSCTTGDVCPVGQAERDRRG